MADTIVSRFDSKMKVCFLGIQENWKPIPDWNGYEVSDLGRVRSFKKRGSNGGLRSTWRLMALKPNRKTDHLGITLADHERRRFWPLQNLVLTVHFGPCPPGMEACHKDGNASDCRLANLRWGTKKDNCADRIRHGRHGKQILKAENIPRIRGMLASGYPGNVIAREYGVSERTISGIKTGATWPGVEGIDSIPAYAGCRAKPGPKPRSK